MDEHELDALVLFGNSGVNRAQHGQRVLALQPPRPPPLLPRRPAGRRRRALRRAHEPRPERARGQRRAASIEWGGYRPAEKVARDCASSGSRAARRARRRQRDVRDGDAVRALRSSCASSCRSRARRRHARVPAAPAVKSEEEVEWLRRAAELTDLAMLAAQRRGAARNERRRARRARRGRVPPPRRRSAAHHVPPLDADGRAERLPARRRTRPHAGSQRGDVIITEFSASLLGLLGSDPPADLRRRRADAESGSALFDVALERVRGARGRAVRAGRRPRRTRSRPPPSIPRGRLRDLRRPRARLRRRHPAAPRRPQPCSA